jgi:hypothetical protein
LPDTTLGGRSIAQKVFQDGVPEENVATAAGRIGTTFLDSLGRTTRTNVHLGDDYQNRRVGVGWRSYDALGRVSFVSDPFDLNDDHTDNYGTSYNYNTDGTPSCFVRGTGQRPASASLDETNEVYPTCFNRFFADNKEVLSRQDPDSPRTDAVGNQKRWNGVGAVFHGVVLRPTRTARVKPAADRQPQLGLQL